MRKGAYWVAILTLSCGGSTSQSSEGGGGTGGSAGGGVGGGSSGSAGKSGSGGSGGSSGSPSGSGGVVIGGGGGMPPAAAECQSAADCMLLEDCCSCASIPKSVSQGLCDAACTELACARNGIGADDVTCIAGRCTFAQSCDGREVTCRIARPECPPGQSPIVNEYCYSGGCLPTAECAQVSDCGVCESEGLSCVTMDALPSYHCVETPPACADSPTCGCMGVCTPPFICGDPESESLACTCIVC
jgi:hypothetical protein